MKRYALLGGFFVSVSVIMAVQTPARADGGRIVFHGAILAPTCNPDLRPAVQSAPSAATQLLRCADAAPAPDARTSSEPLAVAAARPDPLLQYFAGYALPETAGQVPPPRVVTVQYN